MIDKLRAVVQPLPWPLLLVNRSNTRICVYIGMEELGSTDLHTFRVSQSLAMEEFSVKRFTLFMW